jgi:hypothetical protein
MEGLMSKDTKIVYFTIGFISDLVSNNLIKVPIPERNHPSFHYYKPELSLKVMDMFPEEEHFFFTDTDILFSGRMDFNKLTHNHPYPLAVFGPHEYPLIWEMINDEMVIYNEIKLMEYFNVPKRTVYYQFSCFYVFNRSCYEFFEEYTSMCNNQYLIKRRKYFFPFYDETPFNVCLWKRNAEHSLGYAFVNTHLFDTVKLVEENDVKDSRLGKNLDKLGNDWEYVHDSEKILFYHGFKDEESTKEVLNYLLSRR